MKRREQASPLELLIEYGWAVLILGLVIAGLYLVGAFDPAGKRPEVCTLPLPLGCERFILLSNGSLNASIANTGGRNLVVTHLACTSARFDAGESAEGFSSTAWQRVPPSFIWASATRFFNFTCFKETGVASGRLGEFYRGKLYVKYYFEGEPGNYRVGIGDFVARFQPTPEQREQGGRTQWPCFIYPLR